MSFIKLLMIYTDMHVKTCIYPNPYMGIMWIILFIT